MSIPAEKDLERCTCSRCPSYIRDDTGLFCVHGKSTLSVVQQGCLCRTCPVHLEHQLEGREYCLRGKPGEQ